MRKTMRHNEPNGNAGELISKLNKASEKRKQCYCIEKFAKSRKDFTLLKMPVLFYNVFKFCL